jgi:hypothetical protein
LRLKDSFPDRRFRDGAPPAGLGNWPILFWIGSVRASGGDDRLL